MINQLNETPTREEERLITAIAELVNTICAGSLELEDIMEKMSESPAALAEWHPKYCILKAQIIESYTQQVIGVKDEHRN